MYNFTFFQFTANKADIIYFQLIASDNTAKPSQQHRQAQPTYRRLSFFDVY